MKREGVHLDTGHEDTMHPYCGTYLGAGGTSTPRISDATCYACVKVAQERCLASLYEIAFNHGRKEQAVSGHNCGVEPSFWPDAGRSRKCTACDDPAYIAQLKREAREHETAELKLRRVVGYCIESRKEPKELQAAWLRDMVLTEIDPLMNITQQLKEASS